MKVDIVVVYIQRYERGHEVDFVPPITGIHLAAITPQTLPYRVRKVIPLIPTRKSKGKKNFDSIRRQ